MDVSISTYSIDIPSKDLSLFKEMIARMGWSITKKKEDGSFVAGEEMEMRKELSANPLAASFGIWKDSENKYPTSEFLKDIESLMTDSEDCLSQFVSDSNQLGDEIPT